MNFQVITKPATITEDMDATLMLLIKTSNQNIETMAEQLKNTADKLLSSDKIEQSDNRTLLITISVNPKTSSIEIDRKAIIP